MAKDKFERVIQNDKHLAAFLRCMKRFEDLFCTCMVNGVDFNLKMELRGKEGKLEYCRVGTDEWDRLSSE